MDHHTREQRRRETEVRPVQPDADIATRLLAFLMKPLQRTHFDAACPGHRRRAISGHRDRDQGRLIGATLVPAS
jgi:hypothetical protein